MAENIAPPQPGTTISESVRFYISPRGNGSINLKRQLTDEVKSCFPAGRDLHATLDTDRKVLTIKEM